MNKKFYQRPTFKIAAIILGLFMLFGLYQRVFHGEEIDAANAKRLADQMQEQKSDSLETAFLDQNINKALEAVKQEPKVKEALFNESRNIMYVSLVDDGENRDGYAGYICQLLKENHLEKAKVRVMVYDKNDTSNLDAGHRTIMGKSDCDW